MMTRRTLLFAFLATTILTIGFLIFTSRSSEAQPLARIEPSYVLPAQPSIRAFINAHDAEFRLASAADAQRFLDEEMDGDPQDAFEAIEFGYATVVLGDNCTPKRDIDATVFACSNALVALSVDAITFDDSVTFYR